jgi:hypothetical protein
LGLSKVESKDCGKHFGERAKWKYYVQKVNISTDLEIIKGLYKNCEDGDITSSMKPSL